VTALDWIIVLILAASVIRSLMRGLVEEVFSLAAWVLAFLAAKWGAVVVAPMLPAALKSENLRYLGGFLIVFLAMMIAVFIVGHGVKKMVESAGLEGADKYIGALFGLLRGAVILVGMTLAIGLTRIPQTEFWRHATLTRGLEVAALQVKPLLPTRLSRYIRYDR
jgi:membrane protein required for colicin V production